MGHGNVDNHLGGLVEKGR